MENKNIIQYAILAALVLLVLLGIVNFFKTSDNLMESKALIDNVLKEVKDSKDIIQKQSVTIDELQKLNKDLKIKVEQVDSTNRVVKKNLDANFYSTNKTINDIKRTVDIIKPISVIH